MSVDQKEINDSTKALSFYERLMDEREKIESGSATFISSISDSELNSHTPPKLPRHEKITFQTPPREKMQPRTLYDYHDSIQVLLNGNPGKILDLLKKIDATAASESFQDLDPEVQEKLNREFFQIRFYANPANFSKLERLRKHFALQRMQGHGPTGLPRTPLRYLSAVSADNRATRPVLMRTPTKPPAKQALRQTPQRQTPQRQTPQRQTPSTSIIAITPVTSRFSTSTPLAPQKPINPSIPKETSVLARNFSWSFNRAQKKRAELSALTAAMTAAASTAVNSVSAAPATQASIVRTTAPTKTTSAIASGAIRSPKTKHLNPNPNHDSNHYVTNGVLQFSPVKQSQITIHDYQVLSPLPAASKMPKSFMGSVATVVVNAPATAPLSPGIDIKVRNESEKGASDLKRMIEQPTFSPIIVKYKSGRHSSPQKNTTLEALRLELGRKDQYIKELLAERGNSLVKIAKLGLEHDKMALQKMQAQSARTKIETQFYALKRELMAQKSVTEPQSRSSTNGNQPNY